MDTHDSVAPRRSSASSEEAARGTLWRRRRELPRRAGSAARRRRLEPLESVATRLAALSPDGSAAIVDLTRPRLEPRSFAVAGAHAEALAEGLEALLEHLAGMRAARRTVGATTVPEALLVASGLLSARAVLRWEGGVPLRLVVVSGSELPAPAKLHEELERAAAKDDCPTTMLRLFGAHWRVPAAIVSRGRLQACTDELWATLGVAGAALGALVLDPRVHLAAAKIERVASGGRDPELRATRLPEGLVLVEAADPESARCAVEIRRLGDRYRLTPMERHELAHVLRGRSASDAAAIDGVSPETSRERRRGLYKKTGAHGAGRLRALAAGLTD